MSRHVYHTVLSIPPYKPNSFLFHVGVVWMDQIRLCSNLSNGTPAFSTTLILKPCCLTSCWYFLCSWDPGVAGTKMTDLSPALLYQLFSSPLFPFLALPFSTPWFYVMVILLFHQPPVLLCMPWGQSLRPVIWISCCILSIELTGVLAEVIMMWWDKELATRLQGMSIIQKMQYE